MNDNKTLKLLTKDQYNCYRIKNRRPKDPLTPQQVAALTSVATRHQSSTLL
ncbi:unnamed protein product, partial [Adineta steineri]